MSWNENTHTWKINENQQRNGFFSLGCKWKCFCYHKTIPCMISHCASPVEEDHTPSSGSSWAGDSLSSSLSCVPLLHTTIWWSSCTPFPHPYPPPISPLWFQILLCRLPILSNHNNWSSILCFTSTLEPCAPWITCLPFNCWYCLYHSNAEVHSPQSCDCGTLGCMAPWRTLRTLMAAAMRAYNNLSWPMCSTLQNGIIGMANTTK